MKTLIRSIGLTSFALLGVAPMSVGAQEPAPVVLHACYIPALGVTYRIKDAGLPTDCVGKNHVAFSWNQQGQKGDKGDKGDTGETGEAGPPGLTAAGQECPAGVFVGGFTSAGGIICRSTTGDIVPPAPPPPPPPPPSVPPSQWDGEYRITPAIGRSCEYSSPFITDDVVSLFLNKLTGFAIKRISENQLQITPRISGYMGDALANVLKEGSIVPLVDNIPSAVDIALVDYAFPAVNPFDAGKASFAFKGTLTSTTSFSGTLSLSVESGFRYLSFHTELTCIVPQVSFTASKVN
jgi:hypothetical protein